MPGKINSLLGLIITIAALVYLFKINSDTKEDTFQQPFVSGKKEKLFYSPNITSSPDVSLRCEFYQEEIMNPKVNKLGDVFDLNIENIHTKSSQLLLVFFLIIAVLMLSICGIFLLVINQSLGTVCFACLLILGNYALIIINFILSILLFFSFYKSDNYRFVEFLSCKNVNQNEFSEYFFAKKLNKDFTVFIILNFVSLFLNNTSNDKKQEKNQNEQNEQSKVEVVGTKF